MKRTHLVLSGGGVQGISMVAALSKLDLSSITHIAGTSAGAIVGAMLCVCAPCEILSYVQHNPLADESNINIENLLTEYGIVDQKPVLDIVASIFKSKHALSDPSFRELFQKSSVTLTVTGTNIDKQCCEYFDRFNTPDMKVLLALKISMSIPFVFKSVTCKGQRYADGCLTNMFPHNVFDHVDQRRQMRIYCDVSVPSVSDITSYTAAVIASLIRAQGSFEADCNTIIIRPLHHMTVLHGLSDTDIASLKQAGYDAVGVFLKKQS